MKDLDADADVDVDHAAIARRQSMKCRSKSMDLFLSSEDVDTTAAELNVLQRSAPFYKFVLTGKKKALVYY